MRGLHATHSKEGWHTKSGCQTVLDLCSSSSVTPGTLRFTKVVAKLNLDSDDTSPLCYTASFTGWVSSTHVTVQMLGYY